MIRGLSFGFYCLNLVTWRPESSRGHQEVGADTEIADSSLPLSVCLEDTRANSAFSAKPANKSTQ